MAAAPPPSTAAFALLLADARFPAGAHAHSGGLEAAASDGVTDLDALREFLRGRLATAGLTAAALAGAAHGLAARQASGGAGARCGDDGASDSGRPAPGTVDGGWPKLDAEADCRMPSPVARRVSRQLGRQLLRAVKPIWPQVAAIARDGPPHLSLGQGAVAHAAGLGLRDAALLAGYDALVSPATAAVRLLGLDPFSVNAQVAALLPALEDVSDAAVVAAQGPWEDLPCPTGPLLELRAEQHAAWESRLFAS